MIVRPKQNWLGFLFVWNGSVLRAIMPQLAFVTAISCLAVATHGRVFGEKIPVNPMLLTLFGFALVVFLGFRNTASYERFKDARNLWSDALVAARTLTSQILCCLPRPDLAQSTADLLLASIYALKHGLRATDPGPDLERLIGAGRAALLRPVAFKSMALLHALRAGLAQLRTAGHLSDTCLWTLDAQVNELGKAIGGCERIASTPIPYAYAVLLHRTVYTYCVLLPFALVDSTEFFTPLLCVILSYTLIALEAIASEVAEPFGTAPNALALDAMARDIERSVLELCSREIPEPLRPKSSFVLM